MPISWSATQGALDDSFEHNLAQQDFQQSLVFKALQQRQAQEELARRAEQEQYTRRQEAENQKYTRDFNERKFGFEQERTKRDDERADLTAKELAENRAWQQFQGELGALPNGSEVAPAMFEKAKKYHVEGRFQPTGRGTYIILPTAKEIAEQKRDADRDEREKRLTAAQEANLAAQTHRLNNEDARLKDQQERTKILKEKSDRVLNEMKALPPELRKRFEETVTKRIAEKQGGIAGIGFTQHELTDEEEAAITEQTLREFRAMAGGSAPAASHGPATTPTTPAPSTGVRRYNPATGKLEG